jgi:hypothetical protein
MAFVGSFLDDSLNRRKNLRDKDAVRLRGWPKSRGQDK